MVNVTLKQCRYFQAVANHGGVAQASRALNLSAPAIAQAIDKLESACGFPLFIRRHARGFELTARGRAFLVEALKVLRQADALSQAVDSIKENKRGSIRLGCFLSIAPFYLAGIVRDFRQERPAIDIEVRELLHDQLIAELLDHALDLAIVYDLGLDAGTVHCHRLCEARPYILLPAGHRLARKKRLSLSQLAGEPYVLFDAPVSREYFYALLKGCGLQPEIAFRSTSLESVRSAVGNGLGFSILAMRPRSEHSYDGKAVIALDIADHIDSLALVIAHSSTMELEPMHEDFIEFFQTAVA